MAGRLSLSLRNNPVCCSADEIRYSRPNLLPAGIADATGTVLEGTGLGSDAPGVADIAAAAGAVAEQGGGGLNLNPVELLTQLTENSITGLHNILSGMGVPAPYGLSIIFFTLLVKAITFPLTYTQLSSTTKMQTLQPKVMIHRRSDHQQCVGTVVISWKS